MSNDTPKSEAAASGNKPADSAAVKDKKPAPKAGTGPDAGAAPTRAPRRGRGALIAVATLLIVAAACAGGAWYLWQLLQQTQSQQRASLASLEQRVQANAQAREHDAQQFGQQLQALQTQLREANDAITVLRENSGRQRSDWLLSEAEYLANIANYRLLLERDVKTALVALQAADERLREIGDPALLDIRKQLAQDIQALRAVPQPDVPGLALTLGSLMDEAARLPLATPQPTRTAATSAEAGTSPAPGGDWKSVLVGIWNNIKSLVIIRHHTRPTVPLLPPEQRYFLSENLRLQLEEARLALLRGDSTDYRQRLATAEQWIREYFDPDSPVTRSALETLAKLAKEDVAPALPDISAVVRNLNRVREQRAAGGQPAQTEPRNPSP